MALGVALRLFTTTPACAQAWLSPKGHGSVGVTYVYTDVLRHLVSHEYDNVPIGNGKFGRSDALDFGRISADTGILSFDYSLTSTLAASGDVAYLGSNYQGSAPDSPLDGGWVKSFQDLALNLRYRALTWPVVLTPFAGFSTPTHNYPTLGHSSVGVGLRAYVLGASFARGFGPVLAGGYLHGTYAYGFVKNLGDHGLNNHNLDLELGYFATRALSFRVLSTWHYTPDGFDWTNDSELMEHFTDHDRAAAARYNRLGGGVGYSFSRYDVFLVYERTVRGANTHDGRSTILGTSWNF